MRAPALPACGSAVPGSVQGRGDPVQALSDLETTGESQGATHAHHTADERTNTSYVLILVLGA